MVLQQPEERTRAVKAWRCLDDWKHQFAVREVSEHAEIAVWIVVNARLVRELEFHVVLFVLVQLGLVVHSHAYLAIQVAHPRQILVADERLEVVQAQLYTLQVLERFEHVLLNARQVAELDDQLLQIVENVPVQQL